MMSDIFLEHPDQTFQRLTDNHYHLKCEYDRLKSEHAKLEAANKVLREALEIIRQECLSNTKQNDRLARENCGYVAEEALKAADEIERGKPNDHQRADAGIETLPVQLRWCRLR